MKEPEKMVVAVRNPLVAHVWQLMPGRKIYKNWYLGQGAFVQKSPDVQKWVAAYINETDPAVAIGNLHSATERLLRAALKAEGVQGEVLTLTLPNLAEVLYFIGSEIPQPDYDVL